MTAFVALPVPYGLRRILTVDVQTTRRLDLKLERRFVSRRVQHAFEIPWELLSAANRTTLDTFLKAVRGRYLGDIAFVDPWDSVTYTCRLDSDEHELVEASQGRWGASIRLVEVADFKALKTAVNTFPAMSSGAVTQFAYRMGRKYRTEIVAQEDFSERRYEDFADVSGVQRWSVGGDVISNADAAALLNAWEGNGGPWHSFSFTEPETTTVYATSHFLDSVCTHTLNEYNSNSCRLVVEELR